MAVEIAHARPDAPAPPPAEAARALRPLGGMERGVWKTDRGAPMNFTTVARVRGPLTDAALEAGLGAVCERHTLLRARIVADARGSPAFRLDGAAPVTLRSLPECDWVAELERELATPIAADREPLAHITRIAHAPDSSTLLVTLHHAIGDGMSGVFLVRDLVQAAAAALRGEPVRLPRLEERPALDELLPPGGLRVMANAATFLARETWLDLRYGKPVKVRRDRDALPFERRPRVVPYELPPEVVSALTERARRERTTVHGALSAAVLLGILADARVAGARVAWGSPVNVRKQLIAPVGEQVGFFVSMLGFTGHVRAEIPLWELARAIRRRLEADLAARMQLDILRLMPLLYRALGGDRLDGPALAARWERKIPTTAGLTNLGRLEIEPAHAPLAIETCHFAANPSALGDFACTAASLHGRLFWNFIWPDPVLTEAHARELIAGIVERLHRAALHHSR